MKRWRSKHYRIPKHHEPGEQKGYKMGSKHGGSGPSHTPGARGRANRVKFWPVGRWAKGKVT